MSDSVLRNLNSKNRKLNPSNWKQNVKKINKNSGKTYIPKSGCVIPGKKKTTTEIVS